MSRWKAGAGLCRRAEEVARGGGEDGRSEGAMVDVVVVAEARERPESIMDGVAVLSVCLERKRMRGDGWGQQGWRR